MLRKIYDNPIKTIETKILNIDDITKEYIDQSIKIYNRLYNKCLHFIKDKYDLKETDTCILFSDYLTIKLTELRKELYKVIMLEASKLADHSSLLYGSILDEIIECLKRVIKRKQIKINFKTKQSNTIKYNWKNEKSLKIKKENSRWSLLLQKIGWVEVAYRKYFKMLDFYNEKENYKNKRIKNFIIKRINDSYKVFIVFEDNLNKIENSGSKIAFDWGVKNYFTTWDGKKSTIFNLDYTLIEKYNSKLSQIKTLMNKCVFNSNKYKKLHKRHTKYVDKKKYYISYQLNLYADSLIKEYDSFIFEDIDIESLKLKKAKNINKKHLDRPLYMFKKILYDKCFGTDKKVYLIDKLYPSTQMCSNCGNVKTKEEKVKLSDREYVCKSCGCSIDRDLNAAKNIYLSKSVSEF